MENIKLYHKLYKIHIYDLKIFYDKNWMYQAALSIIMAWSLTWIVSLTGPLHQLQGGTKVLIIWLTN